MVDNRSRVLTVPVFESIDEFKQRFEGFRDRQKFRVSTNQTEKNNGELTWKRSAKIETNRIRRHVGKSTLSCAS